MTTAIPTAITSYINKHGGVTAAMLVMCWYFYTRTEYLEAKADACMSELAAKSVEALNNNTRALERLEFRLQGTVPAPIQPKVSIPGVQ